MIYSHDCLNPFPAFIDGVTHLWYLLTRLTNHLLHGMILQLAQHPRLHAGILSSGSSHAMPPVRLAGPETVETADVQTDHSKK